MDCVFCKIIAGEIAAHTVYEDDKTIAFLDIQPSAPGHVMVIPKGHHDDLVDLPDELVVSLFNTVKKVSKMLEKTFGANNFTIGANSGRIVGRHVNHAHIHVIPRFPDDGGGYIQQVVENPPQESIEEIKKKILEANK